MISNVELIKNRLTPRDYALSIGIEINNQGFALCPFHDDTKPSLSFKDDFFKCFTCNTSGDVFSFIQQFQKVGFSEAVKIASEITGIKLDEAPNNSTKATTKKRIIEEVEKVDKSTNIDKPSILSDETKAIYREFYEMLTPLTKVYRAIPPETYELFKFRGIQSNDQSLSIKTELLKNHSLEALILSGLFSEKGLAYYQKSIVFPYFENGEIVYFSNRNLTGEIKSNKLKGIKERFFYGDLNCNEIYIFEGIFDAISFYQMTGSFNFVAVNRIIDETAIKLIKEKIPNLRKIICIFDNDNAGNKSLEILKEKSLENVSFIRWETILEKYDINPNESIKDFNDLLQFITNRKPEQSENILQNASKNQPTSFISLSEKQKFIEILIDDLEQRHELTEKQSNYLKQLYPSDFQAIINLDDSLLKEFTERLEIEYLKL